MPAALTEADFVAAAKRLKVEVAAVKAVAEVESAGSGFLANGRPKILFEGHWFHQFTKGRFGKTHPSLSYAKWTKQFYLGGSREYERYDAAIALDEGAAMKATSFGRFQIMGFNYPLCGYASVSDYVKAMNKSEGAQLDAFCAFLTARGLVDEMQNGYWKDFARLYNGAGYAANQYDVKLAKAYAKHLGK